MGKSYSMVSFLSQCRVAVTRSPLVANITVRLGSEV